MINLEAEVTERNDTPGSFGVEAFGEDGECYLTIFSGPDAESRAREYSIAKFG